MTHRVVITGVGVASPLGNALDAAVAALAEGRSGIQTMREWDAVGQLGTRLAAPVEGISRADYPRKEVRTMGRVGVLSAFATDQAIADAGLEADFLASGAVGLAHGSTHGSSSALEDYTRKLFTTNSLAGLPANAYLRFMSHTTAANLAMRYGITGRIITTCSACVSASQAIGAGFEAVRAGVHEVMVCGGAEELHFSHAGIFDIMYATSTRYNDAPDASPRPFDRDRDGLVVGEGAGTLVLERYDRAKARGAHIHAEVLGYGTNCDGRHPTNPSWEGMAGAMTLALADARLDAGAIDYVNAHGTATELGDIAESKATHTVLGEGVPVSSSKGHLSHTLGACGGIELALCLGMMRDGFLAPTRNLGEADPRCAPLDYLMGDTRSAKPARIMSNNFAFGGINTSLIVGRV